MFVQGFKPYRLAKLTPLVAEWHAFFILNVIFAHPYGVSAWAQCDVDLLHDLTRGKPEVIRAAELTIVYAVLIAMTAMLLSAFFSNPRRNVTSGATFGTTQPSRTAQT